MGKDEKLTEKVDRRFHRVADIEGQVQQVNGKITVSIGEFNLSPSEDMQPFLITYNGKIIIVGNRAENMETLNQPADDALQVQALVVEPLGSQNLLTVQIGDDIVKISTHPTFEIKPGKYVWLRFPADKIRWVDHDSGNVIYN
jgi:multiple sugar transport system ATP-binding protein